MDINGFPLEKWADATALRISDEWHSDSSDAKNILLESLKLAFINTPEALQNLIGTEIIEETYFDSLN